MPGPSVFVTVGTDHHPFTRLVAWADRWAAAHPGHRVVVQHGATPGPRTATGVVALPHEDMLAHMRDARVVVAQGGPAGIMDSRGCGRLPVVLPRDPAHGEHVDDHQLRFAAHLHALGRIRLVTGPDDLDAAVARALADPAAFTVAGEDSPTARTAAAIDDLLRGLVPRPRRRRSWPAPPPPVPRQGGAADTADVRTHRPIAG